MTPNQNVPLRGTRILIAEDDAILALDLACLLQNAGAEVLGPARTLAATLSLAKSDLLSCALLDVNLRRETVFPAAQLLKERGVRIVFYTGCSEPEKLKREWPASQVLSKPASPELIIQSLHEACLNIEFCAI